MILPRQVFYLLLGCLSVVVIFIIMQVTNSIAIIPLVLDLLSLILLLVAIRTLIRRIPPQQSRSAGKTSVKQRR